MMPRPKKRPPLRRARAQAIYLAVLKGHHHGVALRAIYEDLLFNPSRSAEWTRESIDKALDDLTISGRVRLEAMRGAVAAWAVSGTDRQQDSS